MQNQNDDYDGDLGEFDDEFYDEALDESFEGESFEEEPIDSDYQFDEELSDDFSEDQDWDDSDDQDFVDESLLQKEKKSGLNLNFNTIVISGAVVVGLIVLALQVTKKAPTQMGQKFASALSLSGAVDSPVFDDQSQKKPEEIQSVETVNGSESEVDGNQGFLFEPDVLDTMEMELQDTPPMPSPISEEVSIEQERPNIEDIVLSPQTSSIAEQAQSVEVPRAPEEMPDPVQQEEIVLFDEAPVVLEEVLENKAEETVVETQPVQSVAERDLDKDVQVVTAPISPQQQNVSGLEAKLDKISDRLDDMEIQMNQLQGVSESKIENVNETVAALKQELKSVKSKTKSRPIQKAVPKTKAVSATPPKSISKVVWELRAAQPGKAWVSQKGQTQMKPVVIGNTLSGVGRIQDISLNGGRWIVRGTLGEIRQ